MIETQKTNRRDWLASALMGLGLVASYGFLALQGLLFLLPRQEGVKRRSLFAGRIDQYEIGAIRKFLDLEGNEILVRRTQSDFVAYSSTCPHLGCRVRWEEAENRFFCPCHNGVFDPDGTAVSGPPADGGQNLIQIPLSVNEETGVVYIQVKDTQRRRA